jgi:metal-responsive CopG/Arc/MetJ family transcriptional regulator
MAQRVTRCRSVSFRVDIPVELSIAIDRYINERRFETRSELIVEAIQTWIDCEEDDDFWEVEQNLLGCLDD